jgi:hypothetical protein
MAISDMLPGIEVVIKVDGQVAQEYDDPDANEYDEVQIPATATRKTESVEVEVKDRPYVVKYIEAMSGKPFEFYITKHTNFVRRSHHIAYEVELDGYKLWPQHERITNMDMNKKWEEWTDRFWTGNPQDGYTTHWFRFADLELGVHSFVQSNLTVLC